jgi:uncharacterized protein
MSMHIGVATVRLEITDALTLKDKRSVVRSLLDRIRGTFNVSAAEIGSLNEHRDAIIAVVGVANDGRYVNGQLDLVIKLIERDPRALLLDYEIELT